MNLLDEVNQRGTTVLVATHEKGIVDTMKRRVLTLERGTIIHDEEKGYYEHED